MEEQRKKRKRDKWKGSQYGKGKYMYQLMIGQPEAMMKSLKSEVKEHMRGG